MRLYNATRDNRLLLSELMLADNFWRRLRGLLGVRELKQDQGLLILPCSSIHTCGMSFKIDVVFLDRQGRVLKLEENMPPWRISWEKGSHAVLELAAGRLASGCCRTGDLLVWK